MITSAPIVTSSGSSFQAVETVSFLAPPANSGVWTAMPAAETELFGLTDNEIFLRPFASHNGNAWDGVVTRLMVCVNTPGPAGSTLTVQAFISGTWQDVSFDCPIDVAGVIVAGAPPFEFDASILSEVLQAYFLRVVGRNGDGVTSPVFGNIMFDLSGTVFV